MKIVLIGLMKLINKYNPKLGIEAFKFGIKYAACLKGENDEFYNITAFATCKDLFPDIYWYEYKGKKENKPKYIYGYDLLYTEEYVKNDINHICLQLNKEQFELYNKNLEFYTDFCNKYLKYFNVKGEIKTFVIENETKDEFNYVMCEFPKHLCDKHFLASMLILVLRNGIYLSKKRISFRLYVLDLISIGTEIENQNKKSTIITIIRDYYYFKNIIKVLSLLRKHKKHIKSYYNFNYIGDSHGFGVVNISNNLADESKFKYVVNESFI